MRRILTALTALTASVAVLVGFAGPASAGPVVDSSYHMQQYVPGHWPLIALVDHTSQNPNWWHVRDSGFAGWNDGIGTTVNQYQQFQITDDCSLYPNRVCYEIVERNLGAGGSVDGCDWSASASPTLLGWTCQFAAAQGSHTIVRVVIIMGNNHHGDTSVVRVAATRHEIGHGYGLNHSSDASYLMYPIVDGNPGGPRGDESGCVFQIYNAPPCSSGQTFSAQPQVAPQQQTARGDYFVSGEPVYAR